MTINYSSTNLKTIAGGELRAKYSANGQRILRYSIDFRHKVLDLHKEVSAAELFMLQSKVDALMSDWDKRYAEHLRKSALLAGKDAADQATIDAGLKIDALSTILAHTLRVDDRVNWESLKDFSEWKQTKWFTENKPDRMRYDEPVFQPPRIGFFQGLFGRKKIILADAYEAFERTHAEWKAKDIADQESVDRRLIEWGDRKRVFERQQAQLKQDFIDNQAFANAKVDALSKAVPAGDQQAVIEHASLVLDNSDYGDLFEQSFSIDYLTADKTLMVEYELPSPDNMPRLKAVRFIQATGEMKETCITEKEQKANFDSACYQICLRTIHELLEADEFGNIERVLFNGFSTYVDRSTGKDVRACIMSVLVGRGEFMAIDLSRVDPKSCFKSLKGVSASTLSALAPIPPVMQMDRNDRRFVEGRATVDAVSNETNLASMSWEDFEHLVRELFEKEFASRGGEVRVTQASNDGGVDAIAFDPDPISGGKIVIQAKRYTRTVGVSAVRDLYGTVLNEGASKGLLVTTADYGPDAHKFASGKPITLISGANLLHLLAKHGIQAKIDLREARKDLNLREFN
ncbi:restriction endonuclease [Rhizobium sp. Root1220]|uniref:restriction endonuclease n=1 Tax=Rhizobium sp. Root1220 TaxID=1736432 RepID=UPI000AC64049|nr:restriction endonuclease [Rhizobium sp. Root1220]